MNKIDELNIIRTIYELTHFTVKESEKPDFILTNKMKFKDKPFGVEVTELYSSESSARLLNIEGYFDKIIINKQYIHKTDFNKLPVRMVQLISPEGDKYSLNGIIQDNKQTDILISLNTALAEKNGKHNNYTRKCIYHNLIISDAENMVLNIDKSEFIFTKQIYLEIKTSPFREIFLISTKNKNRVYVPLKLILLRLEIKEYIIALNKDVEQLAQYDDEDYMLTFYGFLKEKGYNELYIKKEKNEYQVYYSRYEITHLNTFKIRICYEGEVYHTNTKDQYNEKLVKLLINENNSNFNIRTNFYLDAIEGKIKM